jgi:hypothetical protein
MCFSRLEKGEMPACVEACPQKALQFGERKDLLQLAHKRIQQESEKYLPRVWGEHEFGGTSVLYVSDVDLHALGWPEESALPIPSITEPIISKTPHIGIGVMASLFGLNWIIERRTRLMSAGDSGEAARERNNDE